MPRCWPGNEGGSPWQGVPHSAPRQLRVPFHPEVERAGRLTALGWNGATPDPRARQLWERSRQVSWPTPIRERAPPPGARGTGLVAAALRLREQLRTIASHRAVKPAWSRAGTPGRYHNALPYVIRTRWPGSARPQRSAPARGSAGWEREPISVARPDHPGRPGAGRPTSILAGAPTTSATNIYRLGDARGSGRPRPERLTMIAVRRRVRASRGKFGPGADRGRRRAMVDMGPGYPPPPT